MQNIRVWDTSQMSTLLYRAHGEADVLQPILDFQAHQDVVNGVR